MTAISNAATLKLARLQQFENQMRNKRFGAQRASFIREEYREMEQSCIQFHRA